MTTTFRHRRHQSLAGAAAAAVALTIAAVPAAAQSPFKIEEASIAGIQQAIKTGQTTC